MRYSVEAEIKKSVDEVNRKSIKSQKRFQGNTENKICSYKVLRLQRNTILRELKIEKQVDLVMV